MEETKSQTPRCFTVVMGCCATGKCTAEQSLCGCSTDCTCKADCNCKKDSIRVKPDLGGGNGKFWAGAAVVIAAAAGVAMFMNK